VVLPAVSWAECDGTFTNLERRVQRAPKAVGDPESKAAPDWMILDHLATRMGVNWPYADSRAITAEISRAVPAYAGFTWEALGDQGQQWDAAAVRAQPAYAAAVQPELPADPAHPLALVAGTVLYDGGSLFRLTKQMANMAAGDTVSLNPADAGQAGVADGSAVVVRSPHGELRLSVKLDPQVQPGTAWIPESLPAAPVGALLDGAGATGVQVQPQ
jgi:predicted molibdopterin-dependent oxidoreductase YjgC